MMTARYCLAAILVATASAAAAEIVPPEAATAAKARFDAAIANLRKQNTAAVTAAAAAFDKKVDALIAKAKDAGNLDLVLTLKSEKTKVAKGDATKGVGLPIDAATARQAYESAV